MLALHKFGVIFIGEIICKKKGARSIKKTLPLLFFSCAILFSCRNPGTQETPAPPGKPAGTLFDEDAIVGLYAAAGDMTKNILTVEKEDRNFSLPSPVAANYLESVDAVAFPAEIDKVAFATLDHEGYNSVTRDRPLVGMMIPVKFTHAKIGKILQFENFMLERQSDVDNLSSEFGADDDTCSLSLQNILNGAVVDDENVCLLSGIEADDYSSEVAEHSVDEELNGLLSSDPPGFIQKHGDSWISKKAFGFYFYQIGRFRINDLGKHSRDEVLYAIRLRYGIDRALSDEESFWADWVLGIQSGEQFSAEYPKLGAIAPASVMQVLSKTACSDLAMTNYAAAKAALAPGKIQGLASSTLRFDYRKY